jgi:outer membrane protein assembly factor BamB
MSKSVVQIVLCGGCVIAAALVQAEEWTQFRGSDYGRTSESNVAERWVSEMVAWSTPLPGRGASSPVIFNNRIYLTAYTGYGIDRKAPGDPANLVRHVLCIEAEHGNIVWRKAVPAESDKNEFNSWGVGLHGYASSTPAVDETGIYIFFGETGVLAFSHAGEELWRTNCGMGTHAFGARNSPVLHGNLVIANASVESGDMIALNKSDGSEAWRQSGINRAWNTPVIYRSLNGSDELAVTIAGKVLAFDPGTGKPL